MTTGAATKKKTAGRPPKALIRAVRMEQIRQAKKQLEERGKRKKKRADEREKAKRAAEAAAEKKRVEEERAVAKTTKSATKIVPPPPVPVIEVDEVDEVERRIYASRLRSNARRFYALARWDKDIAKLIEKRMKIAITLLVVEEALRAKGAGVLDQETRAALGALA